MSRVLEGLFKPTLSLWWLLAIAEKHSFSPLFCSLRLNRVLLCSLWQCFSTSDVECQCDCVDYTTYPVCGRSGWFEPYCAVSDHRSSFCAGKEIDVLEHGWLMLKSNWLMCGGVWLGHWQQQQCGFNIVKVWVDFSHSSRISLSFRYPPLSTVLLDNFKRAACLDFGISSKSFFCWPCLLQYHPHSTHTQKIAFWTAFLQNLAFRDALQPKIMFCTRNIESENSTRGMRNRTVLGNYVLRSLFAKDYVYPVMKVSFWIFFSQCKIPIFCFSESEKFENASFGRSLHLFRDCFFFVRSPKRLGRECVCVCVWQRVFGAFFKVFQWKAFPDFFRLVFDLTLCAKGYLYPVMKVRFGYFSDNAKSEYSILAKRKILL